MNLTSDSTISKSTNLHLFPQFVLIYSHFCVFLRFLLLFSPFYQSSKVNTLLIWCFFWILWATVCGNSQFIFDRFFTVICLPKSPQAGKFYLSMELTEISHQPGRSRISDPNRNQLLRSRLGSRGLVDREQFVRIIVQSLYRLGYRKAAAILESESGVSLDSPEYASLLFDIMSGQWESCVSTINSIHGIDHQSKITASFLIWKENFLELLGSSNLLPAIEILWNRISPLSVERYRVHRLAQLLVSCEEMGLAIMMGQAVQRRISLLLDLIELLPPWICVPNGRLEHLVETVVIKQVNSCVYHNSPKEINLYEDHQCSLEQIPSECTQLLYEHDNEVWYVQFSNNGKYLASSSSDCTAIIWMVEEDDTVSLKHCLVGHERPISFVTFSPNDKFLLTSGNRETLKLWDVQTGSCKLTLTNPTNRVITSCAWFPESDKIICSSSEPDNRIFTFDLEGNEIDVWEGERIPKISDLSISPNGRILICVCKDKDLWICEFPFGQEKMIHEEQSITSLSISRDGKSFIVNLNSEEIHLWRLDAGFCNEQPDKFRGHRQGRYVIRSCFGGTHCSFVASGSEDSKIYIWRRHCETPIRVLSGHSMTVNSVTWNHAKPHMLASASDDRTVRIWLAHR